MAGPIGVEAGRQLAPAVNGGIVLVAADRFLGRGRESLRKSGNPVGWLACFHNPSFSDVIINNCHILANAIDFQGVDSDACSVCKRFYLRHLNEKQGGMCEDL